LSDKQDMDSVRGLIFHIVHGSFVDGHGVRTTVFLKGCPLRCVWCCNPEGQVATNELKFTPALCDGCGRCIEVCPSKAIGKQEPGTAAVVIDRTICNNCGKCVEVCYARAIENFGRWATVNEVFDDVKKDEPFYRSSGGGVTIGGGEPTFQPIFTRALMDKCHQNCIHVAVDTCGYTTTKEGIRVLEEADLLLYDLKDMDLRRHMTNTGAPLDVIQGNIRRSGALNKPMIIRIPLIPGYNYTQETLEQMAAFLSGLKSVERVDLLPYHEYGAIKHRQLGRTYELNVHTPAPEEVRDIKYTFERYGLKAQVGG
jgi:pyruvate formate lyase activating enzyme